MHTTRLTFVTLFIAMLALAACGGGETPPPDDGASPAETPETAARSAAESHAPARSPSPEGARVYFVTPHDGDVVSSPVAVEFGVSGMQVVPAGTEAPNAGHHHLLVDTEMPPPDLPIPADAQHIHFGDGSTSTELTLPPGEHTLQLLFADHLHVPHDPPVSSETITITVE